MTNGAKTISNIPLQPTVSQLRCLPSAELARYASNPPCFTKKLIINFEWIAVRKFIYTSAVIVIASALFLWVAGALWLLLGMLGFKGNEYLLGRLFGLSGLLRWSLIPNIFDWFPLLGWPLAFAYQIFLWYLVVKRLRIWRREGQIVPPSSMKPWSAALIGFALVLIALPAFPVLTSIAFDSLATAFIPTQPSVITILAAYLLSPVFISIELDLFKTKSTDAA